MIYLKNNEMINVITSHNEIFNKERLVTDLIKQYQESDNATIFMNNEGPCNDAIGLYSILDYVCESFNFKKENIKIITANEEEKHNEYQIIIMPQHWIAGSIMGAKEYNFNLETFDKQKDVGKNLFGCLYNIPSWNRLCLLSYVKYNTKHSSLLACNISFDEGLYNTLQLDRVITESPGELYKIIDYLKTNPQPLPNHPGHKPGRFENMEIMKFYNDFLLTLSLRLIMKALPYSLLKKHLGQY